MNKKYFVAIFFSCLLLVIIWFRNGFMLGGGESALPFYNSAQNLYQDGFVWIDANVGSPNINGLMSWPFFLAAWILSTIFGNILAQAIFIFAILSIGLFSSFYLIEEFFPNSSNQAKLISALFYLFNFIALVNVWNRFLYVHMILWAYLPLLLLLFNRGIRKLDFKFSILTVIITVIFSPAFAAPAFLLLALFIIFYTAFFFFVLNKNKRWFAVKYLLITITLIFLTNLWWIAGFLSFSSPSQYLNSASAFFVEDNLATFSALSQQLGQIRNVLRFMHDSFFTHGPFWAGIYNFPLFTIFEFSVYILTLVTIIRFRKRYSVLFFGSLLLLGIFFVKGNQPPLGEIFQMFFKSIPLLSVFRNPFEKFGFLIALAIFPLLGFGLDYVTNNFKNSKVFIALILFVVVFFGFPYWSGFVFTSSNSLANKLENYEVNVPSYYSLLKKWFKDRKIDSRLIVLPLGDEGMTYVWDKPYSGVELFGTLIDLPSISLKANTPYYIDFENELSKYQINQDFLKLMPFTNSKYIVWRGDINFKERRVTDPQITKQKLEEWTKTGALIKKFEVGRIAVYEVSQNLFWPKIFIAPKVIVSNETDLAKLGKLDSAPPNTKTAVFETKSLIRSDFSNLGKIIKPSKIFEPSVTLIIQNYTNQELLDRLFYAEHLPDEKVYPVVKLKEFLSTPPKSDYSGWLLYQAGILGKRAAEIYKLRVLNKPEDIIVQSESNYKNELYRLVPDFSLIISDYHPVTKVIRESLLYQWLLLKRSNSQVSRFLADLLLELKIKPEYELPNNQSGYVVNHFDVPASGKYKLITDMSLPKTALILDGKPLDSTSSELELNKGIHEIASLNSESNVQPVVGSIANFRINEKVGTSYQLNIPEVPARYKIEFDYLFKEGKRFDLTFTQDIDHPNLPLFESGILKDEFEHDWQHYSNIFSTTDGATSGQFKIAAAKKDKCIENWWIGKFCRIVSSGLGVEINNFKISRVEYPSFYLVSNIDNPKPKEINVTWSRINPTLYKAKFTKDNDDTEALVFAELFNSNWKLESNGKTIFDDTHFLTNDYANGWLINKKGEYDLTIKYYPQDVLEKGRLVSIFVITGCLCCLIFSKIRRKNALSN